MRETLLPAVEIDGRDALPALHQRDSNMHSGRRLPRPTLFIAEHDDVSGPCPPNTLDSHYTPRGGLIVRSFPGFGQGLVQMEHVHN
jgi:hypothetical protein